MRTYFSSYKNRYLRLLLSMAIAVVLLFFHFGLFQGKILKITNQLNYYDNVDYSTVYILNYRIPANNECIFADTDIFIYKDENKNTRIPASSLMRDNDSQYDLDALKSFSSLESNYIIISQNIASKYQIQQGDRLFVEFSYSSEMKEYLVDSVADTNFDFQNPKVDNDIGIVYFGFDDDYQKNTQCQYALFSNNSKAEQLSEYPQVINSIISIDNNILNVFEQGITILIISVLVSIAIVILTDITFFSRSKVILIRCYFKGMKKRYLTCIPLIEKILFCLLPVLISEILQLCYIPCNSAFTVLYYCLPVVIVVIYVVLSFVVGLIKTRRKY